MLEELREAALRTKSFGVSLDEALTCVKEIYERDAK
jgi:hypothetical protein